MKPIFIPATHNYIAVFLSLACNLKCSYCINRFEEFAYEKGHLTGEEWIRGLNRIVSRADLPVTLGGGEPSLHPDFTGIVNGIRRRSRSRLTSERMLSVLVGWRRSAPASARRGLPPGRAARIERTSRTSSGGSKGLVR